MERQRKNPTSRVALVAWLSVAVLTALPTSLTLPARAQPPNAERRRIEGLAQRARERVLTLQQEADDLATREQSLLVELRRVEVERQLNAERLIQIDADLDETTGQLTETVEQPVAGEVALPFGRQQRTRFGTTIIRNGIEISAREGSLVKAVHEGQVAFADTFTGFGNLVILDHGAQSYSLYGYLSSLTVERGPHVDDQTILGTVGRAPAGASALYFELRIDGEPVDPVEWLQK